ncbi:MAG: S4 domain-containing protein, partial [Candidatus Diapherotrites archaeon]|nr:S4 domain-containing protein [Candidatus Diapherotrites archaeon]
MAKKGKDKTLKRLNVPKVYALNKKEATFAVRPSPGRHSFDKVVSVAIILRDFLGITQNLREVKILIADNQIKVDGKIVKDYAFPVGLFDLLEVGDKKYRVLFGNKSKIELVEVDKKAKPVKLCKII